MPLCRITTNVKGEQISDQFDAELKKLLAEKLNYEKENITVHVVGGSRLSRGGNSADPNSYIEVWCIKGYGNARNRREFTKAVQDLVKKELNITDPNCIFIILNTPSAYDVGWSGGLVCDYDI